MEQIFDTKVTYLGRGVWGCRILKDGVPIQEARVNEREHIGPVFRDMLRMLDKCGWCCELAHRSRHRNKPGKTYFTKYKVIHPSK